jgi:tripartite-type tricarboxylate transporter receptor subunit TctC
MLRISMAVAVVLFSASVRADEYPSKPISIIAVFGPGSASDTLCRVIGEPLSAALKQTVVVDNRPGANGALAATYVARSAPDGYTLLMATNSPLSAAPYIMKNVSYDPIKDFAPLTRVGSFTLMLVIDPNIPVHSVKELIAYAKANRGKLSFASGNTAGIVAGETLSNWAGLDLLHVPYKSTPPALQDIVGGRVSMMFSDLTTAMPLVQSGKLRALATTRIKRSALYPDLPTLDEEGVKNFNLDAWAGLVAPARTPEPILNRLNTELRKIIDDPAIKKKLTNVGFEAFSSTREQFQTTIKEELVAWKKMVDDSGLKPE